MRLVIASFVMLVVCMFAASSAHATPPGAPALSVGPTATKQLIFDWAPVPRSNLYELWFKANDGAPWVKYAETAVQHLQLRINVSVHLLDWRVARYRLAACNPSGCTNSNEVGVSAFAPDVLGYFKPRLPDNGQRFGHTVALSADGKTLAVVAGESLGSAVNSAVVYVFRKSTPQSSWRREARLVPSAVQSGTSQPFAGSGLALTGDGNLLALGLFMDDMLGPNTPDDNGAVYLFRRDGTEWHQEQKLQGTNASTDWYGFDVDLDDTGTILAVTHQYVDREVVMGTTDIYRPTSSGWQISHTVPVSRSSRGSPAFCIPISLSGDGKTFFRNCQLDLSGTFVQVIDTTTWRQTARVPVRGNASLDSTYDGTRFIVRAAGGGAEVYALDAGLWTREGSLTVSSASPAEHPTVAISRDGRIAAVGTEFDRTGGFGPVYPPLQRGPPNNPSGSVLVFERTSAGWLLRRLVKPGTATEQLFGHMPALGDNGRILAVGAPLDSSAATGINGDATDTSAPERGAVWLY